MTNEQMKLSRKYRLKNIGYIFEFSFSKIWTALKQEKERGILSASWEGGRDLHPSVGDRDCNRGCVVRYSACVWTGLPTNNITHSGCLCVQRGRLSWVSKARIPLCHVTRFHTGKRGEPALFFHGGNAGKSWADDCRTRWKRFIEIILRRLPRARETFMQEFNRGCKMLGCCWKLYRHVCTYVGSNRDMIIEGRRILYSSSPPPSILSWSGRISFNPLWFFRRAIFWENLQKCNKS